MIKIKLLCIASLFAVSTPVFSQSVLLYTDDFEGVNAGWTVDSISGSTWELGTPTVAPTNSTHSGVNAWDVDLYNPYLPNTECYLVSPLFDFSSSTSWYPTISFWINWATDLDDGVRMDYSLDSGLTWQVLGGPTMQYPFSLNWYNSPYIFSSGLSGWTGNSSGWLYAYIYTNELNGYSNVKLRFAFTSNGITSLAGFTLDDFSITCRPAKDAGVVSILSPDTNSVANSGNPVIVSIANYGLDTLFSVPVTYTINGIVAGTAVYNGAINPSGFGAPSVLVSLGNMIVPSGSYQICAYTGLPGDSLLSNDTLCQVLTSMPQPISASITDSLGFVDCVDPPVIDHINIFGTVPSLNNGDTVYVQIFFGDGTDTTFVTLVNNQAFNGGVYHSYLFNGFYSMQAIVSTNTGLTDTVISYDQLIIGDTCGNISGKVYADLNSNCIYDGADFTLSGIPVWLMQGNTIVSTYFSTITGDYYFNVPSLVSFDLMIDTSQAGIASYCPPSGKITGVTEPSTGNDFGYIAANGFDLEPLMSPFTIRPNINTTLSFKLYNHNLVPTTGSFRLVMDTSLLHVISSFPIVSQTSGDTLIWNAASIGNYSSGNIFWISVHVSPDASLVLGDTICFTLIGSPISGDSVPGNNVKNVCGIVTNSYDPNTKTVEPSGIGSGGNINPQTDPLTYTVNFQNTGNAVAYNIFILDTIDSDFDISTLQVLNSSHLMAISIIAPGVMKFSFNNILLADSATDEPGSHGYVTYTISPKAGLPDGTQITNTGYIYFDFNPAIVTNTTTNTIDYTLGVNEPASVARLVIYPNPANEYITIVLGDNIQGELVMTDISGRQLLVQQVQQRQEQISVKDLNSGVYFVTLRTNDTQITTKVMVVR